MELETLFDVGKPVAQMKRCGACKELKLTSEFHKHSSSRDGVQSVCKSCSCAERRKWLVDNRDLVHETQRADRRKDARKYLVYAARVRAKKIGVPCTITVDDITIPDRCPVLDIPLCVGEGFRHNGSPSADRIQPKLGYVPGNVRVISWRANELRRDGSAQELSLVAADAQRLEDEVKRNLAG